MPYLTPNEIPEGDDCRPLSIPASTEWLAIVSGALTELTKPYNWEEWGSVTVAEAVERMQLMIDNYYDAACGTCETPGGYRVIRISPTGELEQLDGETWVETTDEYYIPPPEEREGGTSEDQRCLAAENAVNVLHTLYEDLSDSWNGDLDENEAITAFILAAVGIVGFAFAPITWGIVAFMGAVFTALYSALEFIIADLWDADVSKQIKCFLYECSSNDGGVVTFDYACFTGKLNELVNEFSLTAEQQRLYLQISYLLYFIGGVDGLNLAGGTTAITEADCFDCGLLCYQWDFTEVDGGFEPPYPGLPTYASEWVDGTGWIPNHVGADGLNGVVKTFDPIYIHAIGVDWVGSGGGSSPFDGISMELYFMGTQVALTTSSSSQVAGTMNITTPVTADEIRISGNTIWDSGTFAFTFMQVIYTGDPVFGEDNCP